LLIDSTPLLRQLPWVLVIALLAAGCGFHLKGYGRSSPALDGLYIAGFEKQESLAAVLHDNLQAMGTVLAEDPASARLSIEVVEENFSGRVLSVDAGGKALDKELQLSALVRARGPGSGKAGIEQRFELVRQLSFGGDDELGQRNETALMKYDMRSEMADQIIRRLETVK
jgi:LPS-assembly lipoprotein